MNHEPITVWILGDQLLPNHPALTAAKALGGDVHVLLIESRMRIGQHPYQRKKLVLLLSAMRHYAEELRTQGYRVDYRQSVDFETGLYEHISVFHPTRVLTMAAAEYATRMAQLHEYPRSMDIPMEVLPNTQFLVGQADPYPTLAVGRSLIMEQFYRVMRRRYGLLIESDGSPTGGRWNYDADNRKPLPNTLHPPHIPHFEPDAITLQVMRDLTTLPNGVGTVDGFDLAVTRADALHALELFITERLPLFGPYEDAMRSDHATLYHSVLSPYLNLGLLEPLELAQAAEAAYRAGTAPLNSVEGFIRQVIGWREYIYWHYWRSMPALTHQNAWNAERRLPNWFWDGTIDMHCLQHVIRRALDTGYTHHIERLMIVCNFCLLAGIRPQEVNEWFLAAYIDAYDWVMQPNVIGMGLNADGGHIATKPYIASAHYINKMGNYCTGCRYNAKARTGPDACPFNQLYWNFLIANEQRLRANPRLGPAVLGLKRIGETERAQITQEANELLERLCVE